MHRLCLSLAVALATLPYTAVASAVVPWEPAIIVSPKPPPVAEPPPWAPSRAQLQHADRAMVVVAVGLGSLALALLALANYILIMTGCFWNGIGFCFSTIGSLLLLMPRREPRAMTETIDAVLAASVDESTLRCVAQLLVSRALTRLAMSVLGVLIAGSAIGGIACAAHTAAMIVGVALGVTVKYYQDATARARQPEHAHAS